MKMSRISILLLIVMLLQPAMRLAAQEASADQQRFDALVAKAQDDGGAIADEEVREMLKLGIQLGSVYQASLAIRNYLRTTTTPPLDIQAEAARISYLAGDYRTAVARYKAYLTGARETPEAAQAAAIVYTILTHFLDDANDAYQLMSQYSERFRANADVRRFDGWYLAEAKRRNDFPKIAERLALVMQDKLPIEQERLLIWDDIETLMQGISSSGQEYYSALTHARQIVPLVRADRPRQLRYQLYVLSLEYAVGRIAWEEAAQREQYQNVIKAAGLLFAAAPTGETFKEILQVMAGGAERGFDRILWNEHVQLKQNFLIENFAKVPADQRHVIFGWRHDNRNVANQLMSAAQWAKVATAIGPGFFSHPSSYTLEVADRAMTLEEFKQLSKATAGVPSASAAVVNALAAANGDLAGVGTHLALKESWHLGVEQPFAIFRDVAAPIVVAWQKPKDADEFVERALLQAGPQMIVTTPAALFDMDAAAAWLLAAFNVSGADPFDKGQVSTYLHQLDWVPYSAAQRAQVYRPAYDAFKRWTTVARREKKDDAAIDKLIGTLENEFQQVMEGKGHDLAKAPNEQLQKLGEAVVAIQKNDADAYLKQAREIYAQHADFAQTKAPFAKALAMFTAGHARPFDVTAWHQEIIADQVARYDAAKPTWPLTSILNALVANRPNWSGWNGNAKEREVAQAYNKAFEDAIAKQIDNKAFWPWAFDRFRNTRSGSGWSNDRLGLDLMRKLIASRILIGTGYRPNAEVASDTGAYMFLVDREFRQIHGEFPLETFFDDIFVQEAEKTGFLDSFYFNRGRDSQKKIADIAAKLITRMTELPFGYGAQEQPARFQPREFWRWQDHAMNAPNESRRAMLTHLEGLYGKSRWDTYAMGRGYFQTEADVANPAGRKAFFDRLTTYLERSKANAFAVNPPRLNQIGRLGRASDMSALETDILVRALRETPPFTWWRGWGFEDLPAVVYHSLAAQGRTDQLFPLIPHFWSIALDANDNRLKEVVADFATDLMQREKFGVVAVHTVAGDQILGNAMPEELKNSLMSIRSNALSKIGGTIAVARTDPRFPIYQAQSEFLAGNVDSAWEGYVKNSHQIPGILKELDTQFSLWIIGRNTVIRDFDTANELSRLMIQWMDNSPVAFDKETRAQILLTYADISFAMEEFPRARAQYERIAAAREFNGTRTQIDANLKIAEVDRLTKQYDQAAERLERLLRVKNTYIQLQANMLLAKLKYDQEEFQAAKEYLEQVFMRDPNSNEARILEGQVNLRMRRLMEATRLRVGLLASQRNIVPGKPLEVSLEDQNLAVVGSTRSIEIRVWTESGDEEFFNLLPFGESKTKFQGQLSTQLGAPKPRDHILQLMGNDRVYYNFSDSFRNQHGIAEVEPSVLTVATDAELYVSSGEILTREQIEDQRMEMMIRRQLRLEGATEDASTELRDRRRNDQVKPGNFVYVRVLDADRSISAERDQIIVRAETTSGDVIPRFPLTETEPHSGIFEGRIQTGSAQATAYASDSREGVDPNFVISSGDYPAWVGLSDNQRPKTLSVDLNDNVLLNKLTLVTDVPGRQIRSMIVQSSLNARDFKTVGLWPGDPRKWDGSLQAELVAYQGTGVPRTLADFKEYLEATWYVNGQQKQVKQLDSLAVNVGGNPLGLQRELGLARNQPYLMHIRGAFWLDARTTRVFELETKERYNPNQVHVLLAIDGRVGDLPREISRSLAPGLHTIDIYVYARQGVELEFDLLTDTPEPPYKIVSPIEMFSLEANPKIAEDLREHWATIKPQNNFNELEVTFAEGSNARVLRFVFVDFGMDAPAVRKINLLDSKGKRILPTEQDFLKLKQNDILEIVPGDRVTITYTDPKVLTPGSGIHQGFLTATYSDAKLEACLVQYELNRYGVREVEYVPLRRFTVGEKVNIYIDDPDGDVSDKQDEVIFEVAGSDGKRVKLKALETEAHSGIFIGTIYPVSGAPTNPAEIRVGKTDEITVTYFDSENTDPGIPWERQIKLEQAIFAEPQVRIYEVTSQALTERQTTLSRERDKSMTTLDDYVAPRKSMLMNRPVAPTDTATQTPVLIDSPLVVELIYPQVALTAQSKAEIFVQTSRGRAQRGIDDDSAFDVNVPGTLKISATPSTMPRLEPPPGYLDVIVRGDTAAREPLDDGRFTFVIPMQLNSLPPDTLINWEPDAGVSAAAAENERPKLAILGSDIVYVGFRYTDQNGAERWTVRKVELTSDVFFDIMDRKYQNDVSAAYVGETVYIRVIERTKDVSDNKDDVDIVISNSQGETRNLTLSESFDHTGSFKGLVRLVYQAETEAAGRPGVIPVSYGDTVTFEYRDETGEVVGSAVVNVHKGDDGEVQPFTKRFRDREIGVQTQFMIAEAYFELAKKHHSLGQQSIAAGDTAQGNQLVSLARREMAQARKLLSEAIRDNPDVGIQAQAEYLLANLIYEFGDLTQNEEQRRRNYNTAIAAFNNIVATYPDSTYAPKAQYKKGLVYEKMGQIDQASAEYVKLSYRYPDNELVAETIARLGQYFLTRGREIKDDADSQTDPIEKEKLRRQYVEVFTTAASVFGRLSERFPNHDLAGKTVMLAAQCYMRAENLPRAIEVFTRVYENTEENSELRAEAMYWAGHCQMEQRAFESAYKIFTKLTWDYPEGRWAKFARGRLTDPNLNRLQLR